jgi:predicted HicB family RNase H-like nuclease
MQEAQKEKKSLFLLRLQPHLLQRIRIDALKNDMSISAYIRNILNKEVPKYL